MSVQQAYAEMVGKEDLSLERYQVRFFHRVVGTRSAESSRIGICVPKTPRLRRDKGQATDSIIPGTSTVSFADLCR